jgi:hypothetical protein
LNRLRLDYRIFGRPMRSWQTSMPKGMLLKSDGFASSLYDPDDAFPLRKYCAETGESYADVGIPVPLDTFTSYGIEFQRRLVPRLEQTEVTSIRKVRSYPGDRREAADAKSGRRRRDHPFRLASAGAGGSAAGARDT